MGGETVRPLASVLPLDTLTAKPPRTAGQRAFHLPALALEPDAHPFQFTLKRG